MSSLPEAQEERFASKVVRVREVTPKQLRQGYIYFRTDRIPNVIHARYRVIVKLDCGKYLVEEPCISHCAVYEGTA